jgi:uncharacterized protein YbbC (DUF1343 family)
MRKVVMMLALLWSCIQMQGAVKPGIEVLRDSDFATLKGKRVGLITNPTGVDNELKSTIDILSEAQGVELVALFSPEHGVRGDVHAGDKVGEYTDAKTGVKVYSIYGKIKKPTAEMLSKIDVLVYDIQDIGCRSYTFISTMGLAMEACAQAGKEFVVLDRPNPLGGEKIEGCLTESDCRSFVSQYPIPYIYGMTPGELAIYMNEEGLIGNKKVKLTVIKMDGWTRDMTFRDTEMPWILPSPHIPSAETALYYPMSGILGEINYVSIGVGYTEPFKLFCAEWIDSEKLSERMNGLGLPGVKFRPIHIKPYYSFGKGQNIQGVEMYVSGARAVQLTMTQFYVMQELAAMYPEHKAFESADATRFTMFDNVCGTKQIRQLFGKSYRVSDIEEYWHKDEAKFREKSARYYLY